MCQSPFSNQKKGSNFHAKFEGSRKAFIDEGFWAFPQPKITVFKKENKPMGL
jgi:hypothetical protein